MKNMSRDEVGNSLLQQIAQIAILVLAVASLSIAPPQAEATGNQTEAAIVWLVDVSGSMPEIDPQGYWADAVFLGTDLAPSNTQAAFLAVNDEVITQTPLLDVSQPHYRETIKSAAQGTLCGGYTDFNVGLSAALELLEASPAREKHLFFVADICESGFMPLTGNYAGLAETLQGLISRYADSSIKVHLLFMSTPRENFQFLPMWEELAEKTDGNLMYVGNPSDLTKVVESLYFQEFSFNTSVITAINTANASQDIRIKLPAFVLERARIFVSSNGSLSGVQFRADGARASYTESRSYAFFELEDQQPREIILALQPGEYVDARVYLLADGELTLAAEADSQAEQSDETNEYRQKTTLTITVGTKISGVPGTDFDALITMADPEGRITTVENAQYADNAFHFAFFPEAFGDFTFLLSLESQGIRLSADATVSIDGIELPPIPKRDNSLWIAVGVGASLIIVALWFALAHRRKRRMESEQRAALLHSGSLSATVTEDIAGTFGGKLDIYGVLVQGGAAEIPATSIRLERFAGHKFVTLHDVFALAGVPYHYPEAKRIRLLPGLENSLLVKNLSHAVVYIGGQPRHKNQQASLLFGQKILVKFEEEVNEYEIYYHNVMDKVRPGSQIHLELSDTGQQAS